MNKRTIRTALLVTYGLLLPVTLFAQFPAPKSSPGWLEFTSAPIPTELVSAARTDRIAWLAYDKGVRNVWTAAAPAFRPAMVTRFSEDDGIELSSLSISDDGAYVAFVRGLAANGEGWVANATADPDGQERAIWAARTRGGAAWRVAEGSSPVLSPDGRWVLFTRGGQIYRASVSDRSPGSAMDRGEQPFILAWGTNSSPSWSPDGSRIAFVSNRGDHSYIAVYEVRTRTVSYLDPGVDRDASPTWSPDGSRIAFMRRPGLAFGQNLDGGGRGAGGGAGRGGAAAGGRGGRGAGAGGGRAGGGGAGAADSASTRNVPGMYRAAFPGGYTLALMVADVATGTAREVWHNAPDERVFTNINNIRWADESVVFPYTMAGDEWDRYFSLKLDGSTARPVPLITTDGLIEGARSAVLSPDGTTLYYCTNASDIDRRHIWAVSTSGGTPRQVTTGDGIETQPAPLASGRELAVLYADARHPMAPAVAPVSGGKPRVVTTLPAEFPLEEHVVPEPVTLKAADGFEFYNQLFLPRDLRPGERRPAMIFVHGGPRRQMLLGYHYMSFYHLFYGINQWLQSQGYIVLSVNYRSGIGYGRSFTGADSTGGAGNTEYRDVLAAARYLQSRPDVDTTRVGIWGLSYGGLLTAQALARNSDIFRAGVDMAGVHLRGSALDRDVLSFRSSPISEIGIWKSPVLLVHGDDDRNVEFSQTVGLVQLLRAHDVYHELIVIPDDVHETLLESRWHTIWGAFDTFFTRFLWNKESPPSMR